MADKLPNAHWDTANGIGVYCEDTTRYSMAFVRCLHSMGLPNLLQIRDGAIHGEGPEPIPINPVLVDTSAYVFQDESRNSELSVRRMNLTTITVDLRMSGEDGSPILFKGMCDLGCGFILGAESEDGEDGAYFVDEYWSRKQGYSFRIGKDGDRITATVITGQEGTDGMLSQWIFRVR
ncbi:MAG: hypothetical protein JNM31_10665 [Flavobacteriales bacterium]|nr:hypothetical protein [Flavobacteriales bacterium]